MHSLIPKISKITGKPLIEMIPVEPDPLLQLMRYEKDTCKFLFQDGELIGLNLANIGLTDAQWSAIRALEGFDLGRLQALNLSDNAMTEFVVEEAFEGLVWLNLSDNAHLSTLKIDKGLSYLQKLDASCCFLTDFKLPLGFPTLTILKLENNQLKSLILEGDCPKLERIDLENNNLEEVLLPEGSTFDGLQMVSVQNNPLSSTFEVAAKEGSASFARFLRQLALQGVTETYEIKLLIVGEGESGKTTLWEFLQNNDYMPGSERTVTVGIKIKEGTASGANLCGRASHAAAKGLR
jgi:hypothetical protein